MANTIDITKLKAYQSMPTLKSVDTDWIKWVDYLMATYGRALGTQIFMGVWTKRGSQSANTYKLRSVLKNYGIEVDESVFDKINDVGHGIQNFGSGVFKVGKTVLIVGAGVIAVGLALAIFNASKNVKIPMKGGLGK